MGKDKSIDIFNTLDNLSFFILMILFIPDCFGFFLPSLCSLYHCDLSNLYPAQFFMGKYIRRVQAEGLPKRAAGTY